MKKGDHLDVDFPNWALSYLVNADDTGITEKDKAAVDSYLDRLKEQGYDTFAPVVFCLETNEFCAHPAFGGACDTTKVRFMKEA